MAVSVVEHKSDVALESNSGGGGGPGRSDVFLRFSFDAEPVEASDVDDTFSFLTRARLLESRGVSVVR